MSNGAIPANFSFRIPIRAATPLVDIATLLGRIMSVTYAHIEVPGGVWIVVLDSELKEKQELALSIIVEAGYMPFVEEQSRIITDGDNETYNIQAEIKLQPESQYPYVVELLGRNNIEPLPEEIAEEFSFLNEDMNDPPLLGIVGATWMGEALGDQYGHRIPYADWKKLMLEERPIVSTGHPDLLFDRIEKQLQLLSLWWESEKDRLHLL